MQIKKFWVVTHPVEGDSLSDVCSEESWSSIQLRFAGGLASSEIVAVYDNKDEAMLKGQILLHLCGKITLDDAWNAWGFAEATIDNKKWLGNYRGGTYPHLEGYSVKIEYDEDGWAAYLFEKNADGSLNYEKYITLF